MHSSEAKAQKKGTFRVSNAKLDAFNEKVISGKTKFVPSKKRALSYFNSICDIYGDLLVTKNILNKLSSWHFIGELLAIDPDPNYEQSQGLMYEIVIESFDTRKIFNHKRGYIYAHSNFYVHEHFVERILQRCGNGHLSDLSQVVLETIFSLAEDSDQFKSDADSCHLVFKDKVVIVNYCKHLNRIIYKTVILTEFFSERQTEFYQSAYEKLESKTTMINFVCIYPSSGFQRIIQSTTVKKLLDKAKIYSKNFTMPALD